MSPLHHLIALLVVHTCVASHPLIYWTNIHNKEATNQQFSAGQPKSADEVITKLSEQTGEDLALVFLYDQLSMEDFSTHANQMAFLREESKKKHAVFVPAISGGDSSVMNVLKKQYAKSSHEEVFTSKLDEWTMDGSDGSKLIVFHLGSLVGSSKEGRKQIFKANDDVMRKIVNMVAAKNNKFSVFVAGESPSEVIASLQTVGAFHPRHLLATNGSLPYPLVNVTVASKTCIVMDFSNLEIVVLKKKEVSGMAGLKFSSTGSTCTKLVLKATKESATVFDLIVEFDTGKDGFKCKAASLTYKNELHKLTCNGGRMGDLEHSMEAPRGMSYACGSSVFASKNASIALTNLQVQSSVKGLAKWGDAYDCSTFFTMAILTGIFLTLLLGFFMMVGIYSIMAIQTPDRFDDPKGPQISVPQTD